MASAAKRPSAKKRPTLADSEKGPTHVALLRGINVGGNKTVPMAALKVLAEGLGFTDVVTLLNSGNLLFRAALSPQEAERSLEAALHKKFGFTVDVIVRASAAWRALAPPPAFADAQRERPNLVMLGLTKKPPAADLMARVQPYCTAQERVVVEDGAVWIDFAGGSARSKLTPAVLDRIAGSALTTRNCNTVRKITTLLSA